MWRSVDCMHHFKGASSPSLLCAGILQYRVGLAQHYALLHIKKLALTTREATLIGCAMINEDE